MSNFNKICKKFGGKPTNRGCRIDGFNMHKADYLFKYRPKSQTHTTMSPEEFLNVVPEEPFKDVKRRAKLFTKIKKGKPMDPLFLDVDVDRCKVLSHEGRNRAIVSKGIGLKKVPVILFSKRYDPKGGIFGSGGYGFVEEKVRCRRFLKEGS